MMTIGRNLALATAAAMIFTLLTVFPDPNAAEKAENSVAGLYITKELAGGYRPYNTLGVHFQDSYEYLFPDGTYYNGFIPQGYDEFDTTALGKSGRYSVQGDQVTFHQYSSGKEYTYKPKGRQPNCDGLTLSGTYELHALRNTGITFTPDGRFVDRGAMPQILNLFDSRLDSPARTLRPGPGTYSIKNHTITLRYAHGPVFRLFFYVNGDDRGEIDLSMIQIYTYKLARLGGSPAEQTFTPAARLPKIGVPSGWKIGRDGKNKTLTYVMREDLAPGQEVRVLVADPERFPEGKAVVAHDRVHDAIVQHSAKGMTANGVRITEAFASDTLGKILSSTGLLTETNGKKFRMTMFTPMSSVEAQLVVYMADSDDLYRAYLPTVKAMLGEGDASLQAGMTSLDTLLSKMRTNVNALNGWSSEYDPKEESTRFTPPNLPAGQFVAVVVEKREKLTSTLAQAHEESVRKGIASLDKVNGRLEGTPKREERDGAVFSSFRVLLSNGMKLWWMAAATAVGDEMQEVSLLTSNEDLYKQYLRTLKTTLAEAASR